jgi:hypothetical protein
MMGQGLSPEEMAKRTETMKERMAEHAQKLTARAKELREKAAKARASGDTKQAEQLEKAAERLEKGPMTPERGPGWQKAMRKRKLARLKPLWKQYGERLKAPEVRDEFKKHAVRMARLDRMRDLSRNHPKEDVRQKMIERINAMVARENARHRQALRAMVAKEPTATANALSPDAPKAEAPKADAPKPANPEPAAQPAAAGHAAEEAK